MGFARKSSALALALIIAMSALASALIADPPLMATGTASSAENGSCPDQGCAVGEGTTISFEAGI